MRSEQNRESLSKALKEALSFTLATIRNVLSFDYDMALNNFEFKLKEWQAQSQKEEVTDLIENNGPVATSIRNHHRFQTLLARAEAIERGDVFGPSTPDIEKQLAAVLPKHYDDTNTVKVIHRHLEGYLPHLSQVLFKRTSMEAKGNLSTNDKKPVFTGWTQEAYGKLFREPEINIVQTDANSNTVYYRIQFSRQYGTIDINQISVINALENCVHPGALKHIDSQHAISAISANMALLGWDEMKLRQGIVTTLLRVSSDAIKQLIGADSSLEGPFFTTDKETDAWTLDVTCFVSRDRFPLRIGEYYVTEVKGIAGNITSITLGNHPESKRGIEFLVEKLGGTQYALAFIDSREGIKPEDELYLEFSHSSWLRFVREVCDFMQERINLPADFLAPKLINNDPFQS